MTMNEPIRTILRANAAGLSALATYSLCLLVIIFQKTVPVPPVTAMVGLGIGGALIWLGIRTAGWVRTEMLARKRLTLSGIENTLKRRGMYPERTGEMQMQFRHHFNGVNWTLQYEETTGRLVIGMVFPLGSPEDAEVAKRVASDIMGQHKMVRLFVKTINEQQLFFVSVDTFQTRQATFDTDLDRYLGMLVDAMQAQDDACHKLMEERNSTRQKPKIGFYSPMQEKIAAFDKENPSATEAERNRFIESIRK